MNFSHVDEILIVFSHLMSVTGIVMALILFRRVRLEGRTPGGTLAWVLAMVFIPYVAIPLYLLVGGRKFHRMAKSKKSLSFLKQNKEIDGAKLSEIGRSMILNLEDSPPATAGNSVALLQDGIADYNKLLDLIGKAEKSIHFQTYILANDEVGRAIVEALTKRASEGVKVRLLLDAVGCITIPSKMLEPLKKAGGLVGVFMPVMSLTRKWAANLRNHRKLYIFDETIAIIGGRNLGNEYIGPKEDPKRWMDFAIVVEGPAVLTLNEVFAADWQFATNEPAEQILTKTSLNDFEIKGDVTIQTVASGPDVAHDTFYEALLSAIFLAKKRLWIVTPYFVPDDTLLRILTIVSHLGRDVRLVIPRKSDHRMIDFARGYGIRQLAEAGGKVLLYQPRMVHSKLLLIDDDVAAIGSANMDMRSLYLNYEIAVFTYNKPVADEVEKYFMNLFENSILYTRAERRKMRGLVRESLENLGHIMSPLL